LRYIDRLTLWAVNDLFEYWQAYPPVHVLVAAYLTAGDNGHSRLKRRSARNDKFEELTLAVTSAGGNTSNKLPEVYKHGRCGSNHI
jgi:hypothetical protein